jgi:hypothetical protein
VVPSVPAAAAGGGGAAAAEQISDFDRTRSDLREGASESAVLSSENTQTKPTQSEFGAEARARLGQGTQQRKRPAANTARPVGGDKRARSYAAAAIEERDESALGESDGVSASAGLKRVTTLKGPRLVDLEAFESRVLAAVDNTGRCLSRQCHYFVLTYDT